MRITILSSQVQDFKEFLQRQGGEVQETKGDYEILRVNVKSLEHPVMVFRREGKPTCTVSQEADGLVEQFYHEANGGGKSPGELVDIIRKLEKTCKMQDKAAARTMASVKMEKAKAFNEGAKAKEEVVYWYNLMAPRRTAGDMHQIRFHDIENPYSKEKI